MVASGIGGAPSSFDSTASNWDFGTLGIGSTGPVYPALRIGAIP
jgi:hypothetical protein